MRKSPSFSFNLIEASTHGSPSHSRKSDIENERLPPELINPDEQFPHFSNPSTPGPSTPGDSPNPSYPFPQPKHYAGSGSRNGSGGPQSPTSPTSGMMPGAFRPKHMRQQSLGTTTTSPSNRRRSIESTISLIREAAEGGGQDESELRNIADQISKPAGPPASSSRWHGRGPSA